jgi:competence protein ComEC
MRNFKHLILLIVILLIYTLIYSQRIRSRAKCSDGYKVFGLVTDIVSNNNSSSNVRIGDIIIEIPTSYQVKLGDQVEVFGRCNEVVVNRLYKQFYLVDSDVINVSDSNSIFAYILGIINRCRDYKVLYKTRLSKFFTGMKLGFISGIVLGDDSSISMQFFEALKTSGLIHVVIASGGNIILLSALVSSISKHIFKRRVAIVINFSTVLFYLFVVGFEAPLVRAVVMMSFNSTAILMGRKIAKWWILLISAFSMLLMDPFLIHSISFQLSFCATAGLVLWGGPIDSLINRYSERNNLNKLSLIFSSIGETFAVWLGVVPILGLYFNEINLISFISNMLVLFLIAPLTIIGILILGISYISLELAKFISWLIDPLLDYILWVVNITSDKDWGSIEIYKYNILLLLIWLLAYILLSKDKQEIAN